MNLIDRSWFSRAWSQTLSPPFHVSLKLSLRSGEAQNQIVMLEETVCEHLCPMYHLGPQSKTLGDLSKHCSFPLEPRGCFWILHSALPSTTINGSRVGRKVETSFSLLWNRQDLKVRIWNLDPPPSLFKLWETQAFRPPQWGWRWGQWWPCQFL